MDKPILSVLDRNLSLEEINNILDKDRIEVQNIKSRKVRIKSINNDNDTKEFNSISDCIKYLNSIAPSNKTTLLRRIVSGESYQGYLCEYLGDGVKTNFKSTQVSVTHLPTNETKIYPSYRQAALSFAPKYNTTGQTIKEFSTTGEIFKNEYLISII
jgi:hypothetical protein